MGFNRNVIVVFAIVATSFMAGRVSTRAGESTVAAQPAGDEGRARPTPDVPAMRDVATPGRHHRVLDRLTGKWEAEFTLLTAPEGEPVTARGTVTREWILGGRFVKEVVEAASEAGAFEGIGYLGYDNFDGQYRMIWMDNQSTAIQVETGTYHPDPQIMHIRGSHRDPVSGRLVNTWSKLDVSNPDRHTMTGHATDPEGRTFKAVEGVLERAR